MNLLPKLFPRDDKQGKLERELLRLESEIG